MGLTRAAIDAVRPRIAAALFAVYSAVMLWELFLGPYRSSAGPQSYNLIPFATLSQLLLHPGEYGLHTWFINVVGNVVTFMPLGFLLPRLGRGLRKLRGAAALCFGIILSAESLQYVLRVGAFDVDDIILNMAGCLLGWMAWRRFAEWRRAVA